MVEPSSSTFRGLVNTFQAVIASDGLNSFVRFNYGDLQWETGALIGISAGDTVNFIQDPSSLTASVLSLANSALVYRIDVDNVPCKFYIHCAIEMDLPLILYNRKLSMEKKTFTNFVVLEPPTKFSTRNLGMPYPPTPPVCWVL